MLEAWFLKNWG